MNLLNLPPSFKQIRTFLIYVGVSGGQGASHCSTACRMFTSRKMQHYSWKKIQRREVETYLYFPSVISKIKNYYTTIDHELSVLLLSILTCLCPFPLYFPFRYPELAAVCRDRRTLILYPGPKSENLEELVQQNEIGTEKHNVIIIDGTWSQAKNMFLKNSLFHLPKQVYSYLGISLEKEVVNQIKGVNQAKNNSSQICTVVSVCYPFK